MDKVEIREYIDLLRNDFSQYIPNDRGFTSDISPRTVYWDLLRRLEIALDKI